jgi:hypothetical protein
MKWLLFVAGLLIIFVSGGILALRDNIEYFRGHNFKFIKRILSLFSILNFIAGVIVLLCSGVFG